jgi:Zn-dependent protease
MGPGPLLQLIQAISESNTAEIVENVGLIVVILLIAFPLHELAHALAADRLGDDTPRQNGRISLNPFVHLNLFGSIMFLLVGFGFATTPINPMNFRGDWRVKHALVAVAGPLMNLLIAIVCAGLIRIAFAAMPAVTQTVGIDAAAIALSVLDQAVLINVLLFFFNLIPLPPLDGGTIMKAFASEGVRTFLDQVGQFGWIILIALSQAGIIRLLIQEPVRWLYQRLIGL